jgi:hypothetical protein
MNSFVKSLAILFAANMVFSAAVADNQTNLPAGAWEQHPEGIALALRLTTTTHPAGQANAISISIKNISKTPKQFSRFAAESGIQIFYLKKPGAPIPLGTDSVLIYHAAIYDSGPVAILPNATLVRVVKLTSKELVSVKSYPVKCIIRISDPTEKKDYKIESSPKMLVNGP